ncbi:AAA family ATPase [Glycomyces buryatensis]|uniref:ATP-binding protein n=1 Tax=Glycomyces buryatensis TaxID=2570927 RepID=A0A4S8QH32_9ACTN|nr:AAA family ATPase [Glycomyces buryatensis]THV42275.1 ATP-binding protein [Glycomyces buryatensis]
MPRLILLNGAPATGKSTLAERYLADHPMALNLDIDRLRRWLGRWKDDPGAAGLRARAIALAGARDHLTAGFDVVVPQLLGRTEFIEQLEATAAEAGARFHEIYLEDSVENALRRFAARTEAAADPVHADAHVLLPDGEATLRRMHEAVEAMKAKRPQAIGVKTIPGDVERTYAALLDAVNRAHIQDREC